MTLSQQIAKIEQENIDLRAEIEALRNQPTLSPAVDELLDLLQPEVLWAETTKDTIHRKEFYVKLTKLYRELRPKE